MTTTGDGAGVTTEDDEQDKKETNLKSPGTFPTTTSRITFEGNVIERKMMMKPTTGVATTTTIGGLRRM
jgi:hypothetical protein